MARRTVSALPDCLASHYSATLVELEGLALAIEQAPSLAMAANVLPTGIGLLAGESHSGKTTLCRRWCKSLHPGLHRAVYAPLTTGNVMDRYKSLAWEFDLPAERNRASAFRQLRAEVTRLLLQGKQLPVVIIGEAHHLRNDVLEDLRLLTNYERDWHNRLCLLFVGLTELRRRLRMDVHESLDQRIVMRYHLGGLTREELTEYVAHRLRNASCRWLRRRPSRPSFRPPEHCRARSIDWRTMR